MPVFDDALLMYGVVDIIERGCLRCVYFCEFDARFNLKYTDLMLNALIIIIVAYTGFIIAYHYYGKALGRRLFGLVVDTPTYVYLYQDLGC